MPSSDNRSPRAQNTRENVSRPKAWKPPSVLPEVEDRNGYKHRWIRTALLGDPDNTNVSMRFREGWEAAPADEYPELMAQRDFNSRFQGNVEIGGLMLCRMSAEQAAAIREYQENMAESQVNAVDKQVNLMRESDQRMPITVEQSSRVSFGKGTP